MVVVAAGNEANGNWHYITMPADADGAIAVGAVDVPGSGERMPQIASFSSRGPTADGRIKPDVVAPGSGVAVADLRRGGYVRKGGTSFAAPLVSGVCALLLQKNPEWGPDQVLGGFAFDRVRFRGGRSRHSVWLGTDKTRWRPVASTRCRRRRIVCCHPFPIQRGTGWCIFRCS